ncbi:MAG: CotH kinase family protein, partial [Candidatus Hydrogenedentota bacterium]
NNNVNDPSLLREALSYELFSEAGIPCSRIGFARVRGTVPGKFDQKMLGLYSVVEQVDKRFLKDRYGSDKGLLLKPSTFGVFRYFGDDWAEYETAYVPKTDAETEQKIRVIEFAKLLHEADDEVFDEQVDDYLDVDQFLRFLAVNVLLCNLDSFLGSTQNYYIYLEPESKKVQILPWDMDHSFGAFPLAGTPESRRELSIDHPDGKKKNRLIARVLNIPRHKEAYHEYLATYLETIFEETKVHQQIATAADFLRPLVSANGAEAPAKFEKIVADKPSDGEPHAMKLFVSKRHDSVRRQLDGQSEGEILISDEAVEFPVRRMIGFAVAFVCVVALNAIGLIWSTVAGFRAGLAWGFLNFIFYPIAPVVYGFAVRKEMGRRSAIWAVFCTTCVVAWIVAAVVSFT